MADIYKLSFLHSMFCTQLKPQELNDIKTYLLVKKFKYVILLCSNTGCQEVVLYIMVFIAESYKLIDTYKLYLY